MEKFYKSLLGPLLVILITTITAYGQTTISGNVKDGGTGDQLAGVNIIVKGTILGTITDGDGNFTLKVNQSPPLTIVLSFIGFRTQEIEITEANTTGLTISMEEQNMLGQEVVISASRIPDNILESPVAIEQMDIRQVQNTPSDNYYKAIANMKGVDIATSSINFQIINTRGFASTGNTRFVQLTDGMDTQAPALNFPIGNLNGPSELDVESLELLPGASSALYGPNAFNGVLLVNSKNAFEYQGLSAFAKLGVNHVGNDADFNGPSPVWEGAIRYAKAFNNKFAFKVNLAYMEAEDWHGTSAQDREIARTPEGFGFNPGADRLHYMGDEASINMAIFGFSSDWLTFAGSTSAVQNNNFGGGVTASDYALAGDLPNHVITPTPYSEVDLIDYNAKNMKANVGLYYRLTDKLELSYLYNGGFGTSVYTGAQRYSLKNFGIQQHRIQLKADNFFVRAYTTMEDSGDSYITEFLAKRIYDQTSSQANALFSDIEGYLATYPVEYLRYLNLQGLAPGEINTLPADQRLAIQQAAHEFARNEVDNGASDPSYGTRDGMHPDPNSQEFKDTKAAVSNGTVPDGPKFNDKTNLYHAEFQYDLKNQINFMEWIFGGSYRLFDLNSNGTIFDDKEENITISEYGIYTQVGKWFADRKLKLSGSLRYDKNENFEGRFNPRISAVVKIKENHNLRVSFQTGFRIPSTQGQHIDLSIISSRLLGGLPRYEEKYDLVRTSSTGEPLAFTGESVNAFRNAIFANPTDQATAIGLLVPYTKFEPVKPERVKNIEIGYKSLINNNLLFDISYYYNIYNDFITQIRVVTAAESTTIPGTPNYLTMLNGSAHTINSQTGNIDGNTSQIYSNFDGEITSQGAVAGITYSFLKGYSLGANYNWNVINDTPSEFFTEFNTPEHKVNVQFGNPKLTDKLGFNITYRWQEEFLWQSSFTIPANGFVPSYNTVDAQISYRVPSMKSVIKLGGSNILNQKYIQSLGGVNIGALYYISVTFDELMR